MISPAGGTFHRPAPIENCRGGGDSFRDDVVRKKTDLGRILLSDFVSRPRRNHPEVANKEKCPKINGVSNLAL